MSAYIVEDEMINKIVSYLYANANGPDPSINWKTTKLFGMGFDFTSGPSCPELAQKMFDLNVAAVNARYGEREAEKFSTCYFQYRFVPASQIEVIKALKAWKYQCTEGQVPDLALYKAMLEVHSLLCIDFVEHTKEYIEGSENE
jgi:hypothetical protein